ncbi:hypothetical protein BJX96DRAFT_160745 [Aspergillus floccosus]
MHNIHTRESSSSTGARLATEPLNCIVAERPTGMRGRYDGSTVASFQFVPHRNRTTVPLHVDEDPISMDADGRTLRLGSFRTATSVEHDARSSPGRRRGGACTWTRGLVWSLVGEEISNRFASGSRVAWWCLDSARKRKRVGIVCRRTDGVGRRTLIDAWTLWML